jgi:hypothetical protein
LIPISAPHTPFCLELHEAQVDIAVALILRHDISFILVRNATLLQLSVQNGSHWRTGCTSAGLGDESGSLVVSLPSVVLSSANWCCFCNGCVQNRSVRTLASERRPSAGIMLLCIAAERVTGTAREINGVGPTVMTSLCAHIP